MLRHVLLRAPRGTNVAEPTTRILRFVSSMADDKETLAALENPFVLDVRDPEEVQAGKGGPPLAIPGSTNVPLNIDGTPQSERPTTIEEFTEKLQGVELPSEAPIVVHCGRGGRAERVRGFLKDLGYENVYNGGNPSHLADALGLKK